MNQDDKGITEAAQLVASGAFDESFYLRMAGKRTSANAARHFLLHGRRMGISPHPLIDLTHIDAAVVDQMRNGKLGALLEWLRSNEARKKPWGPLFDPRTLQGADPLTVLKNLQDDSPVPVGEDFVGVAPTLSMVRDALMSWAGAYGGELKPTLPARRKAWDQAESDQWVSTLPAPASGLVSVIMPAKDREDSIAAAIESVLGQSHADLELIVIDDGSTDSTRDIVTKYAAQDTRVVLIEGPHRGVGPARSAGLSIHRGEYLAFLDSDNTWTENYLDYSLRALSADTSLAATHAGLRMHGDSGIVEYRGSEVTATDLRVGNSIDINVVVARAAAVKAAGGFDLSLRRWVDYDLVLRLTRQGELRYLPFVGCDYSNHTRADRITRRESAHWEWVVKGKNLVDWREVEAMLPARVDGRVSVVVLATGTYLGVRRVVDSALRENIEDLEIILVDCASSASTGHRLVAAYAGEPRVRYVRLPADPLFAGAANVGFAQSTGTSVVFVDNSAVPREGWLESMVAKQQASNAIATQALLVDTSGVVLSAGFVFLNNVLPVPFLAGHPTEDARAAHLDGLTAVSRHALLIDASTFVRVQGFDPFLVDGFEDIDFCLRVRQELGAEQARFAVAQVPVAVDLRSNPGRERRGAESKRLFRDRWGGTQLPDDTVRYEERAFRVTHMVPGEAPHRLLRAPLLSRTSQPGELRWAIKIGANYTQDRWGDVPFADDLAKALRHIGQSVVIDRFGAHERSSKHLDDVVLTIRGRHEIPPQRGATNILWVISRPDLVTVEEVNRYDAVFAASEKWAAWMTVQSGRNIEVLHQATDPERFRPTLEPLEPADDLLFVGAPRTEEGEAYGRRLVGLAVQANAPIGVWGHGWENFVPREHVRDGFLDFELTPRAYRSAEIALNDHWADMRDWGFISNRAFDIIATGTPVISDEIDGLEIFDGAAVSADSVEEMAQLVADRTWVPSPERMAEISKMVREQHSFAARAATLLDAASAIRASRVRRAEKIDRARS